jgi:hypothetical protein
MQLRICSRLLPAVLPLLVAIATRAEERRFTPHDLLTIAVTENLAPAADGKALELVRGRRVEDDGPAAGYSYLPSEEKLDGKTVIRKQLEVADPRAGETYLLLGGSGTFEIAINGKRQTLESRGKTGNVWEQFLLPPETLRRGLNDIVVTGTGKISIARDDERPPGDSPPPNRSAKSTDGGKTWNSDRLGTKNDFDGEYYVRLYLDQHRERGMLTLPIVDRLNLADKPLAPPTANPSTLSLQIDAAQLDAGQVEVAVRRGTTYAPDDEHWSKWEPVVGLNTELPAAEERYLQVRLIVTTTDPRRSPQLRGIRLSADVKPADDWSKHVRVVAAPTTRLVRASIPFVYESGSHPQLKKLREQFKLDEVVAGAKTEWEKITKLAAWSGVQWSKRVGHLGTVYPKWDALDILTKHDDGTPIGGFCQQYNLVFLQACESFGIRGRPVSLGPGTYNDRIRSGHEVVELWSNDYRKWVHVDGDAARYYVDVKTRTPLSLRELHDLQLAEFAGRPHDAVEAVVLAETRPMWQGLTDVPPFVELRMIPRSNVLDQPTPLPLNQGMRGWSWPGHFAWTDASYSPSRLYDHRVAAPSNWDWTLNMTEVHLTAGDRPGEVQVELDTVTPGFAGYEALFDEAGSTEVEQRFIWTLHPGRNRLSVASRNETGSLIPTVSILEWNP